MSRSATVLAKNGKLLWPHLCVCCGTSHDLLDSGEPLTRTTAMGNKLTWHVPYCLSCKAHRHAARRGIVLVGGFVVPAFLFLTIVYAIQWQSWPTFFAGVSACIGVTWLLTKLNKIKANALMHSTCSHPFAPIRYLSSSGGKHTFEFVNETYGAAFEAMNKDS